VENLPKKPNYFHHAKAESSNILILSIKALINQITLNVIFAVAVAALVPV